MGNACVIVFAKAPRPGEVKTRLARSIGKDRAAAIAARMLDATLAEAVTADIGPVELCGSPDAEAGELVRAARRVGVTLHGQGEGDLGQRMARAFARAMQCHERVLAIGTDCPGMTADVLRDAHARLAGEMDAVFRPAIDGGYVLIGLRHYHSALFADIPWSSARVMSVTRKRMRGLGWRWWEGAPLADVDEPADLARLPVGWVG